MTVRNIFAGGITVIKLSLEYVLIAYTAFARSLGATLFGNQANPKA